MNWKFWKKAQPGQSGGGTRLPGPRDLPQQVGRQLVVVMGEDPDWVWNLRSVARPREGEKNIMDIRIYSTANVVDAGIVIRDYHSLDEHAELILYQGHYQKNGPTVHLEKR